MSGRMGRWARHWPGLAALLILLAYTPFLVRMAIPGSSNPGVLQKIPVRGRWVALAFDDGPSLHETRQVIQELARYHDHASFFVVGLNVSRARQVLRQAVAQGNQVENHTEGHINLAAHTYNQDVADLEAANRVIYETTGSYPHWLIPPYGAVNRTTRRAAAALHLRLVSASPGENIANGAPSVSAIIHQVLSHVEPGAIIVLHDGSGNGATVKALPSILSLLRVEGYQIGSIGNLERQGAIGRKRSE